VYTSGPSADDDRRRVVELTRSLRTLAGLPTYWGTLPPPARE
jgi:hypothetical protein